MQGNVYNFLIGIVRVLQTSVTPLLFILDYVKDIVLYLILRTTLQRLEDTCKPLTALGIECLTASGAEEDLLTALLVSFCVSLILTSINAYFLRTRFFRTNCCLNILFALISPLLPAIYHIKLCRMKANYRTQRNKLSNFNLRRADMRLEALSNSVQQIKEMEVGLEALVQICLLSGLVCFYPYVFQAPSGQSYSYFFGVALLVLKGNKVLFFASLFCSFLGPCVFYVRRTNLLRHGSLNVSRKSVLVICYVLFLLVRVLAIVSAIFIPVIKEAGVFVANEGIDASDWLDDQDFRLEFQHFFRKALDAITTDIRKNFQMLIIFLFLHLMLVASHAIFHSTKFGKSMMRERFIHLVTSFWLPMPFLTIRGVDRGNEKVELCFLVMLHTMENLLIVFLSRLVYLQESYPLGIVVFDSVLLISNLLGVAMSVFYVFKKQLYADLPHDIPGSPSFRPEVCCKS